MATLDHMKYIGLQWSKLGRILLCTGTSLLIRDKLNESNIMQWGIKNKVATAMVLLGTLSGYYFSLLVNHCAHKTFLIVLITSSNNKSLVFINLFEKKFATLMNKCLLGFFCLLVRLDFLVCWDGR